MWGEQTPFGICRRYRNLLLLSLVASLILVPIMDGIIIQRDRNRNMLYGEMFLTQGFSVYNITDEQLNESLTIPQDHLLTGILNVTYEYPIVTLAFFAGLAALEPGVFGPHYLANVVLVLLMHLDIVLFLYIGQEFLGKKWFKQFFCLYYLFGISLAVGFGKAEPLADLFWLVSLALFRNKRYYESSAVLGVAVQTKVYPALFLPILAATAPVSLIFFLIVLGSLLTPLLIAGASYSSLLQHLLSSTSYATSVSNPFYIGLSLSNPIAILAPLALVIAFIYSVLEHRKYGRIPIPVLKFRTREWKNIIVYLLPLALIFVSWVLIWYYFWFIIPVLYIKGDEDPAYYRYLFIGLLLAHFLGLFLNLDYFLAGPIMEFFGHIKIF
ncbi:MAG: glycosyltransferase 87 family protein [Candidatus Thorarchaeota archaeon]